MKKQYVKNKTICLLLDAGVLDMVGSSSIFFLLLRFTGLYNNTGKSVKPTYLIYKCLIVKILCCFEVHLRLLDKFVVTLSKNSTGESNFSRIRNISRSTRNSM